MPDFILALLIFIFGAAIGSFLNVVILRTHEKKSFDGRSQCPYCHHQLSVVDRHYDRDNQKRHHNTKYDHDDWFKRSG